MNALAFELRGYAIPFGVAATPGDGVLTTVEPGGIAHASSKSVQLLAGHHEGSPIAWTGDGTLQFFEDDFGLAFRATVPCHSRTAGVGMAHSIARCSMTGCSVSFDMKVWNVQRGDLVDGRRHRLVKRATIDHVAILNNPAYGDLTGVWLADAPRDSLPAHLADLARRWDVSWHAHRRTLAANAKPAAGRFPSAVALARFDRMIIAARPDLARCLGRAR